MRVSSTVAAIVLLLVGATSCGGDEPRSGTASIAASDIETIDGIEVDLSLLPPDLHPLAPLIRKYAAGDDVERTDRLYAASTEELRELDRAMTAERFDAIDAFLNAHMEQPGMPQQDVAIVLSSFAEAAAEAGVILEERDGSG